MTTAGAAAASGDGRRRSAGLRCRVTVTGATPSMRARRRSSMSPWLLLVLLPGCAGQVQAGRTGAHDPGPWGGRRLRDGPADPLPRLDPGPGRVVVLPRVRIARGVGRRVPPDGDRQSRGRRDARHALGPPLRRPAAAGSLHPDGRAGQGVPPGASGGHGRRRARRPDRPAPPLDRRRRAGLVFGRHAHPPHARRAAQRDARRGPERRVAADRLGPRGVRHAGREARGVVPRPRGGPGPGRRDPPDRPAEHRVRDLHGGQGAAHPRGVLRAEPQDARSTWACRRSARWPAGPTTRGP